jgi:transcriptional regulator with XRE-family HTH domain
MDKKTNTADMGNELKRLRGDVSAKDFADKMEINLRTYYRYERGDRPIKPGLMKVARMVAAELQTRQPEQPYDHHGGWKPSLTIEEMTGIPAGLGMARAVDLLASIYASRDETLIRAINAQLEALSLSVDRHQREMNLEAKLSEAQKALARRSDCSGAGGDGSNFA